MNNGRRCLLNHNGYKMLKNLYRGITGEKLLAMIDIEDEKTAKQYIKMVQFLVNG